MSDQFPPPTLPPPEPTNAPRRHGVPIPAVVAIGLVAAILGGLIGAAATSTSNDENATAVGPTTSAPPPTAGSSTTRVATTTSSTTTVPTTTVPPAGGSRENPVPVGQVSSVGDGWTVKVVNVTPDASAQIKAANMFNDPPSAGRQFFMVTVEATNGGTQPESALVGLRFEGLDDTNVAYTQSENDCGVIPNDFPFSDVFPGGTVTGNVCWEVDSAHTASLLMSVSAGFSDDRTFFAVH